MNLSDPQLPLYIALALSLLAHLWPLLRSLVAAQPLRVPSVVPVVAQPVPQASSVVSDAAYAEALAVIQLRHKQQVMDDLAKVLNLGPVS